MSSFEERARARQAWPIRQYALGQEPLVDERDVTTVTARIQLVLRLTREQWALSGRPWPTYTRAEMPGQMVRLDEQP